MVLEERAYTAGFENVSNPHAETLLLNDLLCNQERWSTCSPTLADVY